MLPPYVKIKERSFLARLATIKLRQPRVAMVISTTIHLWGVTRQEFLSNPRWLRHELTHVEQFKKLGTFRFLVLYLWQSIVRGYRNNRFEVEARASEVPEYRP